MAVQKDPEKKGTEATENETVVTTPQIQESTGGGSAILEKARGSLDNVLAQAERAYTAYMDAQKEVARA